MASAPASNSQGSMRKAIAVLLLFVATFCSAQQIPDAPSTRRVQGYIAGGYVFDVRETDSGVWGEIGLFFDHQKFSAGMSVFDDLEDVWGYRAIQPVGRYYIVPSFAVEGGQELGYGCFQAKTTAPCERWLVRWYTPFAGIVYRHPISKHLSGIARMDLTRSQLTARPSWASRGKDGGLRFHLGVVLTP